jgi:helix-turn-helix protein
MQSESRRRCTVDGSKLEAAKRKGPTPLESPESVLVKPGVNSEHRNPFALWASMEATLFTKLCHQHREKVFGEGRSVPLDRNTKARIMTLARALTHRTEKGKHYGVITAKFLAVLDALLWGFHNCGTGRCFPSYEAIAERADCTRSTVYEAIHALERAGILTWVNRIVRIREWGPDLFGRAQNRWRVIRTSNAYAFVDPKPSKSELPTGTADQELKLRMPRVLDPANPLHQALTRLGRALEGKGAAPSGAAKGLSM